MALVIAVWLAVLAATAGWRLLERRRAVAAIGRSERALSLLGEIVQRAAATSASASASEAGHYEPTGAFHILGTGLPAVAREARSLPPTQVVPTIRTAGTYSSAHPGATVRVISAPRRAVGSRSDAGVVHSMPDAAINVGPTDGGDPAPPGSTDAGDECEAVAGVQAVAGHEKRSRQARASRVQSVR